VLLDLLDSKMSLRLALFFGAGVTLFSATALVRAESVRLEDPGGATRVRIHNPWGSIEIKGWSRQLIQLELIEDRAAPGEQLHSGGTDDISFVREGSEIRISSAFARDQDIVLKSKMRSAWERQCRRADLRVRVPERLSLELRAGGSGGVSLSEWVGGGSVDIRTGAGPIRVSRTRLDTLAATCGGCGIELTRFSGSGRLFSGDAGGAATAGAANEIRLKEVSTGTLFVETAASPIRGEKLSGRQTYITREADIFLRESSGSVEFTAGGRGRVELRGLRGFASGRTAAGDIKLEAREWRFDDAALFESLEGAIELRFPPSFSAELDLMSAAGRTEVAFSDIGGARLSPKSEERAEDDGRFGGLLSRLFKRGREVLDEVLGLRESVSSAPELQSQDREIGPQPPGRFVGSVGPSGQGRAGVVKAWTGGGGISVLRSVESGKGGG